MSSETIKKIYCGDSKFVLEHDLFDRQVKVDLIYLDPPFFTEKVQKGTVWSPEAMEVSYNDSKQFWADKKDAVWTKAPTWLKDLAIKQPAFASYLFYMMERLQWCHHILKNTGSIYLHCDYRASHYLKMIMDKIFGVENFRNEIIWKRSTGSGGKTAGRKFTQNHDTIFFYSKSDNFVWNQHRYSISDIVILDRYILEGETGDISVKDLVRNKPYNEVMEFVRNLRMKQANKLKYCSHYGRGEYKYLDESGIWIDDIWIDIESISEGLRGRKERTGYPTQKPEKLLERIIKASSNEGDLVLDPFCGCGTAIVAAQKLNRQWIGIDINPDACKIMQKRFKEHNVNVEICWRDITTIEQLNPLEFEKWVNEFLEAKKPMPDSGVDGITKNGTPIQTKTFEVGYKYVSQFLSDIKYHPQVPKPIKSGIIVSQKGFESSAISRAYQIKEEEGIEIKLVTPKELIPT